jgi:hypothetical protein
MAGAVEGNAGVATDADSKILLLILLTPSYRTIGFAAPPGDRQARVIQVSSPVFLSHCSPLLQLHG